MQHDNRRSSDVRIDKIIEGNDEILEMLRERRTADALLNQRVENIEIELKGKDGEGGIKAQVQEHDRRINLAIGGMAVLTFIGGFLGWCADKLFKAATSSVR